ncbi:hypothetical protein RYX36_005325 [Vicia faba]
MDISKPERRRGGRPWRRRLDHRRIFCKVLYSTSYDARIVQDLLAQIRDLAEERIELTEKKRIPIFRKGFDVKLIDVIRTCKVTKGGQVVKYTAMLACGNYNGVVGFAKAKGPAVPVALQKAYEKCFQNLHYVERHEEHTIAHAI